MMTITGECRPEEVQAFATRRPADEGSLHYSPRGRAQTLGFTMRVPPSRAFRDVGVLPSLCRPERSRGMKCAVLPGSTRDLFSCGGIAEILR